MTPEQLVPDRETCERLRAAGFPQDTYFGWCRRWTKESEFTEWEWEVGQRFEAEQNAAPTAAEIMEDLATGMLYAPYEVAHLMLWKTQEGFKAFYGTLPRLGIDDATFATTAVQALAELWLKARGSDAAP